jgi:hypothetical protein
MAQGIGLPLKEKNGRLVKLSGDDYISQLVNTGLKGSESNNPFQDLGLGEFMIFGINDVLVEGEIRQGVERVFDSLKADQLAEVVSPSRDISFESEGHEKKMHVFYKNMETQERDEIEVPIPTGA